MLKSRMSFVVSEINKTEKFSTTKLSMKVSQVVFVWCQSSHTHIIHVVDWLIPNYYSVRSFVPSFHYFRSARVKARGADGQNVSNMHWDVAGARVDLPIEHEGQRRLQFTRRFLTREVSNLPFARAVPPVDQRRWATCFVDVMLFTDRMTSHDSAGGCCTTPRRSDGLSFPNLTRARGKNERIPVYVFVTLKIWLQEFDGLGTKKKKLAAQPSPQWAKKVRKGRAGHLVPQGPLERRPCSPCTNCTPPGPRTAARADRAWIRAWGASTHWRTGARRARRPREPGASWALGRGRAPAQNQNNNNKIILVLDGIASTHKTNFN